MTIPTHSLLSDGGQRYTDQELLTELKRVAAKLEKTPTFQEMEQHGKISAPTYHTRFGSWNDALDAANLERNPRKQFTNEELLKDLRQFADELGRAPTSKQMNERGPHNSKTYKDRFDTWNNALREAGFEPHREGPTARTEEERKQQLLDDLVDLARELGRVPTQKEIREQTPHSHNTYYDHWGSVKNALQAAGIDLTEIDTSRRTRPRSIETEDLLDELRRLNEELGHAPRWVDIRKHGKYSDSPYRSRFDSLDDALEQAGISHE